MKCGGRTDRDINPLLAMMDWNNHYEAWLERCEGSRHTCTHAEFCRMLNHAELPKSTVPELPVDRLLDEIRSHPNPPYTPDVLIVEWQNLWDIPITQRLDQKFAFRVSAWIDRVEAFLQIGKRKTAPVSHVDGWTRSELIDQVAEAKGSFGATTFDGIRIAAGIPPAEYGGKGRSRRFGRAEVRKLIETVESGNWRQAKEIANAWRDLLAG